MKRLCAAVLGCSLLLVGAVRFSAPAVADDSDPFCAATPYVVPWDASANAPSRSRTSDDYAVWLSTDAKKTIDARVTFITGYDAWSAKLHAAVPQAAKPDPYLGGTIVHFSHPVHIYVAYADGAGADGAAMTDCPSDIQVVQDSAEHLSLEPGSSATASFLQNLPKLSCASMYTPMKVTGNDGRFVPLYGHAPRDTTIAISVNSDGQIVRTRIYKSSGVDGLDALALDDAQHLRFEPATFLCVPIVGTYYYDVRYEP